MWTRDTCPTVDLVSSTVTGVRLSSSSPHWSDGTTKEEEREQEVRRAISLIKELSALLSRPTLINLASTVCSGRWSYSRYNFHLTTDIFHRMLEWNVTSQVELLTHFDKCMQTNSNVGRHHLHKISLQRCRILINIPAQWDCTHSNSKRERKYPGNCYGT